MQTDPKQVEGIPPALTPGDCARYVGKGDEALRRGAQQMIRQGRMRAAAALLLQVKESEDGGGPLFTQEIVDALEGLAIWITNHGTEARDLWFVQPRQLRAWASALESILPPEQAPSDAET